MSGTGFRHTALRSPGVARCPNQIVPLQRGTPPQAATSHLPLPRPTLDQPVRVAGDFVLPMDASPCRLILEIGSTFDDHRLCQACAEVGARVERLGILDGTSSTVIAISILYFVACALNDNYLVPWPLRHSIVAPMTGAFRTAYGELWLHRKSLMEKLKDVGGKLSRLEEPKGYAGKDVNMRLIMKDRYGKSAVPNIRRRGHHTHKTVRAGSNLSHMTLAE